MGVDVGVSINQYKILSRLGAGGMGEVYLAMDSRLERKVALKLLNEEVTKMRSGCAALNRKRARPPRSIIRTSSPFMKSDKWESPTSSVPNSSKARLCDSA